MTSTSDSSPVVPTSDRADAEIRAAADAFATSVYRSSQRYLHWTPHERVAAFLTCTEWEWILLDATAYRALHHHIHTGIEPHR